MTGYGANSLLSAWKTAPAEVEGNDLGMLARFHYACESDYSVMPYSIRAINAMTLFDPSRIAVLLP